MKLNNLLKLNSKSKKRIGRGLGSGKGKTSARGSKGQKARGKIPPIFVGSLPLYKKLPLRKGLGNPNFSKKIKELSLDSLNIFKAKSIVGVEDLIKANLVTQKQVKNGIKVLGGGEIKHALTVKLPVSKSAKEKIEKMGGKVE